MPYRDNVGLDPDGDADLEDSRQRITKAALRQKGAEISAIIDDAQGNAKRIGMAAGALAIAAALGVAFVLGRRRGLRSGTVVEIRQR